MLVVACAAILFVAGCAADNGAPEPTTPPVSPSAAVTTTSGTTLPAAPTSVAPALTPSAEAVTSDATVQEPYVVECLEGTPGPARWSDGSMAFSQWCFDQHSGNEYLRREREANTFECDGQVCRNPTRVAATPIRMPPPLPRWARRPIADTPARAIAASGPTAPRCRTISAAEPNAVKHPHQAKSRPDTDARPGTSPIRSCVGQLGTDQRLFAPIRKVSSRGLLPRDRCEADTRGPLAGQLPPHGT